MQNSNDYKGFSLFKDIEDQTLRNRNRAVILTNIIETNLNKETKKVNVKGTALVLNYFSQIPEDERKDVEDRFTVEMIHRGFIKQA